MQNSRSAHATMFLSAAVIGVLLAPLAGNAADAPSHLVYVTNEVSGDLSIIDGDALKVVATVPLGRRPRGIEARADGRLLFIALSGSPIAGPPGGPKTDKPAADKTADGIGVFDTDSRHIIKVIRGVSDPEKLAVSKDGKRLYIASEDSGSAVVMDTDTGKQVANVKVGGEPEGVRVNPTGLQVFVTSEADNQVSIIDTGNYTLLRQIKVGKRPRAAAFSPDGAIAYVPGEFDGTITVIDTKTLAAVRTFDLGNKDFRPMDAVVSSDGKTLYLSTGRGKRIVAVNIASGKVEHTVESGARPWGISLSPDGKLLYVANGPSNDVGVIDLGTFTLRTSIPAGKGPWSLVAVAQTVPGAASASGSH